MTRPSTDLRQLSDGSLVPASSAPSLRSGALLGLDRLSDSELRQLVAYVRWLEHHGHATLDDKMRSQQATVELAGRRRCA